MGIAIESTEEAHVYKVVLYRKDDAMEISDPLSQSPIQFRFDFNRRQVYFQNQFDGSFDPIGVF